MPESSSTPLPAALGLVRVIDGVLASRIHTLSLGPLGTVIGSVEVEGACITDVEADVSARHVVVWCQDGRWWCQGLGSANGTVLISGEDKQLTSVELPRSLRDGSTASVPVELREGDALCLGLRTRFLVLRMGV